MKKYLATAAKLFALFFYLVSYLFPRRRNLWVFGEAHGFNNNSKYLFLDIVENHKDINAVWIGDKQTTSYLQGMGFKAYSRFSVKGIFTCLLAKLYIVSWTPYDINFYTSGGAYIVNLWHGVGWKSCLWEGEPEKTIKKLPWYRKINHFIQRPFLYIKPKVVLSSSKYYTDHVFSLVFDVPKSHCVEAIYPRCSFLLKSKDSIKQYLRKFRFTTQLDLVNSFSQYDCVYLYTPTFRDSGKDFMASSGIDFIELNDICKTNNSLFLIKLHPSTKFNGSVFEGLNNIQFLDRTYDLYPIMPFTDVMISDYSSIMTDYMLLNKKIIMFTFDMEDFKKTSRSLLLDFDSMNSGIPHAYYYEELKKFIIEGIPEMDITTKSLYWAPKKNLIEELKQL